jgi:hypothetical protein
MMRRWIKRLMEHGLSLPEIARFLGLPLVVVCQVLNPGGGEGSRSPQNPGGRAVP